jgi:hypothetical protein
MPTGLGGRLSPGDDLIPSAVGRQLPTIGEAYAVSVDGGRTLSRPSPISPDRWNAAALEPETNGPCLREREDRTVEGRFV